MLCSTFSGDRGSIYTTALTGAEPQMLSENAATKTFERLTTEEEEEMTISRPSVPEHFRKSGAGGFRTTTESPLDAAEEAYYGLLDLWNEGQHRNFHYRRVGSITFFRMTD